jgi:glutamyl-tRNA synthetase
MSNEVRVRIAPSPTGLFHIGTARTALFNFLFAKQNGGKFFVRFEDTDKDRSKKEYVTDITDGLTWLGITFDGVWHQSERTDIYVTAINKLIENGYAYVSQEMDGERTEVIRFKNPGSEITFYDLIRGEIKVNTKDLGDFIIAKSLREPLYHLAVVADDIEMKITHVIRGEDHISNTSRQILIQEALGAERPIYAHIPLTLAADRSKLSKRHGALSINEYKKEGYLAEAVINFLALLGWHPHGERGKAEEELFTMDELIQSFSIDRLQKGGAVASMEKLDWLNKKYMLALSDEDLSRRAKDFVNREISDVMFAKFLLYAKSRITKLSCLDNLLEEAIELPDYAKELLLWRGKIKAPKCLEIIDSIVNALSSIDSLKFSRSDVEDTLKPLVKKEGTGAILWPLRASLSGRKISMGPYELADILGKDETIRRLKIAVSKLL